MYRPLPHSRGREAGVGQPEQEGKGQSRPQRPGILHQTVSRLPVANHVFLGSWIVDICQEGHSLRSAPHRRHTAHLRKHSHCAPRKPTGWYKGRDKMHRPTWGVCACQAPGRLLRPRKGTHAQLSLCLCGVPENLNLSGLDLGSARNPGPALDSSLAEQPGA